MTNMGFYPLQGHRVVLTHVRTSDPTKWVSPQELEDFVHDLGGAVVDASTVPNAGTYVVVNDARQLEEPVTDLEGEVMVLLLGDWLDGVYAGVRANPVVGPLLERFIVDTADFGKDDMRGSDLRRVLLLREFTNSLNALTHKGGEA